MALQPSASEAQLYNLNDTGRLAVVCDLLISIAAALGGGVSLGFTPSALVTSQIAVGGTAVQVAAGPISGGFITNPASDASQGVTAEPLYVDIVAAPGSTDATANGTTIKLDPGGTFVIPAMATGTQVRVNAATTAHQFSGAKW